MIEVKDAEEWKACNYCNTKENIKDLYIGNELSKLTVKICLSCLQSLSYELVSLVSDHVLKKYKK